MSEAWWFPLAMLSLTTGLLAALAGVALRITERWRETLGGALIVALAVAVCLAYAHSVLRQPIESAEPTDCPGAPYAAC